MPDLTFFFSSSRIGPWSTLQAAINESQKYFGLEGFMLVMLPLLYGRVHLAAWNCHFATQLENKLWRAASFDLVAQSVLMWPGLASSTFEEMGLSFICNSLSLFNILLYFLGRSHLVIESFVGLRHVPLGVYAAVPWATYVPHI
jgi:hypothetical protein